MIRRPPFLLLVFIPLAMGVTGCVKKSTHQGVLDDLSQVRTEREELRSEMEARLDRCEAESAQREAARDEAEQRLRQSLARTEEELQRTERRRSEAESRFEEARTEVHRLEVVLGEQGSEFRQLERRLRSLAAIEREVQERNAIYEEIIGKFRSLIQAGQLSVSIDRGRMVIQLPQDILFESGSATLGGDGRRTVAEVGRVLSDIEERTFQVEGHTDDVPIATSRFPSNWELSTARALSVVRLLSEQGVPADRLSGAGYAEFQPVASNEDAAGRRLNRRIEIVMLPNLDVIAAAQVPAG